MDTQLKVKKATPHHGIWVPKRTIQAQRGSTQVWVPKRVLKEHYSTRPRTQEPKRQQKRQRTTKKTTQRVAHSKRTSKEGQQKTRQIWVKKTLLKAQGNSTYKWVPKQLLHKNTNPAKQPTYKQQRSTRQTWPMRKITEKWIPKDTLAKQGYFEGACSIWIPKTKKRQEEPKQQETSLGKSLAGGQMKLKWMPKGQQAKQATKPKSEIPRQPKRMVESERKSTTLEKGKWVPKKVCNTKDCHMDPLPSTSSNTTTDTLAKTTAIKRFNQPLSGTNPLDVVKQLVFILRTFNSKQVDAKWKQFMASKATGRASSPTEALGPHLLQDPPLAQQ